MNDNDAAYQRPPQGPESLTLEIIFDGDHLAGIGGSPRATIWLHGILQRMRAYESELADYGRTVKRLNDTISAYEGFVGRCPGDCIVTGGEGCEDYKRLKGRLEELKRK